MADRVQKLLAQAGIASRRACEEFIKDGRVSVNGVIVGLGATALTTDDILLDGKKIALETPIYILLNKPMGVTCTLNDPHAGTTLLDIVKVPQRIFPVGRLDRETEGLLILTNDGALMQRLTHPSKGVTKTYVVTTDRPLNKTEMDALRRGVVIEGKRVELHSLRSIEPNIIELSIHEGRKHIVRNIIITLGHRVKHLVRTRVGTLGLGSLAPGRWRMLTAAEVTALKKE